MSTTKLTRREQREHAQQFIDTLAGTAFPNSRRIYVHGSQADIRVPMREIQLSPTLVGGDKDNPGTKPTNRSVYDTSGPYGDPDISIDVRQGWQSCASRGSTRVTTARRSANAARPIPKRGWPTTVSMSCASAAC